MKRYKNDPFWMQAKFSSDCSCGKEIKKGDSIFYYPTDRTAICADCGKRGESDLYDEMLNEQMAIR